MLILRRTTPREEGAKRPRACRCSSRRWTATRSTIRPIPKMGRNAVDTNELFIDDLFVPDEDRVGEEGTGFRYLLAGLNAERIISRQRGLGIGRAALRRGRRVRQGAGRLRPADRPEPGHRLPARRGR